MKRLNFDRKNWGKGRTLTLSKSSKTRSKLPPSHCSKSEKSPLRRLLTKLFYGGDEEKEFWAYCSGSKTEILVLGEVYINDVHEEIQFLELNERYDVTGWSPARFYIQATKERSPVIHPGHSFFGCSSDRHGHGYSNVPRIYGGSMRVHIPNLSAEIVRKCKVQGEFHGSQVHGGFGSSSGCWVENNGRKLVAIADVDDPGGVYTPECGPILTERRSHVSVQFSGSFRLKWPGKTAK